MEVNNQGLVIKKVANDFWVKYNNDVVVCKPRGSHKFNGIYVGDYVEFSFEKGSYLIEKVLERKNILIRPPLANLEQLIIVISPVPKPDFFVVDKLILFAYCYGIEPILIVNKQDLSNELNDYVTNVYSHFIKTIFLSAKTSEGVNELYEVLSNKISAFAGQSAVGKSALINSLFKFEGAKEGVLSEKINRGKNTTRHCEIYFNNDIMIADTAGFSSLDETLLPIAYYELPYYYPDFNVYKSQCKYTSCVHYKEPSADCKIKSLVNNKTIDKERYLRYRKIYEILQEKWVRTHG